MVFYHAVKATHSSQSYLKTPDKNQYVWWRWMKEGKQILVSCYPCVFISSCSLKIIDQQHKSR
jgi:hypothetical protein